MSCKGCKKQRKNQAKNFRDQVSGISEQVSELIEAVEQLSLDVNTLGGKLEDIEGISSDVQIVVDIIKHVESLLTKMVDPTPPGFQTLFEDGWVVCENGHWTQSWNAGDPQCASCGQELIDNTEDLNDVKSIKEES